jgi:hypothetical protein
MGFFGSALLELSNGTIPPLTMRGRGSNAEAHWLARFASSMSVGRYMWLLEPPEGLKIPVIINFVE